VNPDESNVEEQVCDQVVQASSRCCACIEILSQKTYAAPQLLFKDGDDLSGTEDVVVDSGSTMTLTSGPLNCRECKPVKTKIQLAKKGETMQAQYKCIKTYYFRDRSGTLQKVELPAYIVPELQSDLIGCKNLA